MHGFFGPLALKNFPGMPEELIFLQAVKRAGVFSRRPGGGGEGFFGGCRLSLDS